MGNAAIDGLFLDDFWSNFAYRLPWSGAASRDCSVSLTGGPSEVKGGCIEEMGLSAQDVDDIATESAATMDEAMAKIVAMKGYSWQMVQYPGHRTPDCAVPSCLALPKTAAFFRAECAANSSSALHPIFMRFTSPTGKVPVDGTLPWFEQDLAAFLLIRSEYAWLGYSWAGCDRQYVRPTMLDNDFGEPLGGARCKETSEGSGIFSREWTNAHVSLDTNTNKATITMKPASGLKTVDDTGKSMVY